MHFQGETNKNKKKYEKYTRLRVRCPQSSCGRDQMNHYWLNKMAPFACARAMCTRPIFFENGKFAFRHRGTAFPMYLTGQYCLFLSKNGVQVVLQAVIYLRRHYCANGPGLGWNATITDTHYNFRECLVDLYKAVFRISRVVSHFVSPVPTKSSLSVYCVLSVIGVLYSSSSCWMPCGALSLFQPQQSMHRPRDLLIYISCSSMGLSEPIGWLTTSGVTWLFCIQHIND